MTDWQSLLYDPIYTDELIGVDAVLIKTTGERINVRAIEETEAFTVPGSVMEMQSARPTAFVRMAELVSKNINLEEYVYKGQIYLNGKTWRIKSYEPEPSKYGFNEGEMRLILTDEKAPNP